MDIQKTALIFAIALVPSMALADDHEHEWPESYTSLGLEYNYTLIAEGRTEDTDDNITDFHGYGINLAHQYNSLLSLYAQAAMAESETTESEADIDVESYSVGLRIHPSAFHYGDWRAFAGGGYKYSNYDIASNTLIGSDEVSENALFAEAGLQKLIFNQRFIAEAGIRAIGEVQDTYLDFQPFLGVSVLFGRSYPKSMEPVVLDSDNDGVVDGDDQCPNTPAGAVVDATGCEEKDSDMDGVLDKDDACPDTPQGAKVDAQGCAEKLTVEVRENLYIAFPSNSSAVPQESIKELENIARLMKEYPSSEIQVFGHTDSRGSASYNMKLSDARASAVGKVLSAEYDISLTRINSQGMGETAPVATNDTPEGRAKNRRVELVLRQPE